MAKFKNKKSGKIIEENLIYYINQLRKNPNFEEVVETSSKNKEKEEKENKTKE